jgi:hypothetical protein
MGNGPSHDIVTDQSSDFQAIDRDKQINAQLTNEQRQQASQKQKEVKILFLGLQDSDRMLTIQKIKQYIRAQNKLQMQRSKLSRTSTIQRLKSITRQNSLNNSFGNTSNNNVIMDVTAEANKNASTDIKISSNVTEVESTVENNSNNEQVVKSENIDGTDTLMKNIEQTKVEQQSNEQKEQSEASSDAVQSEQITTSELNAYHVDETIVNVDNGEFMNNKVGSQEDGTLHTGEKKHNVQPQEQQNTNLSKDNERKVSNDALSDAIPVEGNEGDEEYELEESLNKQFKEIIHFHTLNGFQQLLQAVTLFDLDFKTLFEPKLSKAEKNDLAKSIEQIRSMNFSYGQLVLTDDVVNMIVSLWKQPGIQSVYEKRHDVKVAHFSSLQHLGYFMENLQRITTDPYIPSDEDINFAAQYLNEDRTGIEELRWNFSGQKYRIFNVKGKYNDCRKWLFQFEGVDVVCFLCPLGDYDLPPDQKGRENVLKESLNLFDKMCNSDWFRKTPVMLVMTKFEVFREKINDTDLICCFHDYNGGCVYQSAVQFVTQKFLNVRKRRDLSAEILGAQNDDEDSSGIFPIYTSSGDDIEVLMNNIGGTLKNILYLQRVERQKQAKLMMEKKRQDESKRRSFGLRRRSIGSREHEDSIPEFIIQENNPSKTKTSSSASVANTFFSGLTNILKRGTK